MWRHNYVGDSFSWLGGLWADIWELGELVLLRESSRLSKSSSSSSTSTSIFSSSSNDVIDLPVGDDAPKQFSLSPFWWFWSLQKIKFCFKRMFRKIFLPQYLKKKINTFNNDKQFSYIFHFCIRFRLDYWIVSAAFITSGQKGGGYADMHRHAVVYIYWLEFILLVSI